MDAKAIFTIFASLSSASLPLACDKRDMPTSDVTEVPGNTDSPTPAAGEHACGNHEEGACGGETDTPSPAVAVATTRTFEVAPTKFAEVNFQMKAGSNITVTFGKASSDMEWNVHSHDHSGGSMIHDEGLGHEGTVVFTAPQDGMFSVIWTNNQAAMTALEVSVALSDGATIHSWIPAK